jgi:hypothetical protein
MAETARTERPPKPPQPPEVRRRVAFHRYQIVGMPLIVLLPVLGAFGVFDNHRAVARAESGQLELRVVYYRQIRKPVLKPMLIVATNRSPGILDRLVVTLDRAAVESEESVQMIPQPKEADEKRYRFEFESVPPGESRTVEIEVGAGTPGTRQGMVEARTGSDRVSIEFQTFAFP